MVEDALAGTGGNQTKAAAMLGVRQADISAILKRSAEGGTPRGEAAVLRDRAVILGYLR